MVVKTKMRVKNFHMAPTFWDGTRRIEVWLRPPGCFEDDSFYCAITCPSSDEALRIQSLISAEGTLVDVALTIQRAGGCLELIKTEVINLDARRIEPAVNRRKLVLEVQR